MRCAPIRAGAVDVAARWWPHPNPRRFDAANAPEITLMSFPRAEAYSRLYPFFPARPARRRSNLGGMCPPATSSSSRPPQPVVRPDFHPALSDPCLSPPRGSTRARGLRAARASSPRRTFADFPVSDEAARFYRTDPPSRPHLPFWAASLVDRMRVMLLPLLRCSSRSFKIVPPTYRWRIRRKIFKWYREVQTADMALAQSPSIETSTHPGPTRRAEHGLRQINIRWGTPTPTTTSPALRHGPAPR